MSATTIYDVQLRYTLDDRATAGTRGFQGAAREAAGAAGALQGRVAALAGAFAGGIGLYQARKALIDFNSEMEQAKITVAGLMQLNLGGNFLSNMERANVLVSRLQQEAKTSVGTTADMVKMLSMITQPLTSAGASMDDLVSVTKGSVVASRAMGIAAEVAARDVDQAIRGQFHVVDQFSTKILGPMGFVGEEGRARFNRMSQEKRFQTFRSALEQPAIKEMAKAQGQSFAGELSTFQDNLQITFGKIGLPLFKEITAEVHEWNKWIEANDVRIQDFAAQLGKNLTTAFHGIQAAGEFFIAHKDTILTIAKVFGALQLTKMAAGGIGSVFTSLTSLTGAVQATTMTLSGPTGVIQGFGGLVTKLTSAAGALTTLSAAAIAVGTAIGEHFIDKWADRQMAEARNMVTVPTSLRDIQQLRGMMSPDKVVTLWNAAGKQYQEQGDTLERDKFQALRKSVLDRLTKSGLINQGGLVDREALALSLEQDRAMRQAAKNAAGVGLSVRGGIDNPMAAQILADEIAHLVDQIKKISPDPDLTKKPDSKAAKVNVTIHRIEVASDDPDRFAFQFVESIRDVAKNPGAARNAFREGG